MFDREIDLGSAVACPDAFEEGLGFSAEEHEDIDARAIGHQSTHLVEHLTTVVRVGEELGERGRPQDGEVRDHELMGVGGRKQIRPTAEEGELRGERRRRSGIPVVVVVEERADRDGVEEEVGAEALGNRS